MRPGARLLALSTRPDLSGLEYGYDTRGRKNSICIVFYVFYKPKLIDGKIGITFYYEDKTLYARKVINVSKRCREKPTDKHKKTAPLNMK